MRRELREKSKMHPLFYISPVCDVGLRWVIIGVAPKSAPSLRQVLKQIRRHLCREFFEKSNGASNVPVTQMYD